MKTETHRLPSRTCNCYLVKEEGLVLVDAGPPKQGGKLLKALRGLAIEPGDISLILLTHGHWDHIGSASELKGLTGCKVAINRHEKEWVEQALKPMPPGIGLWGKAMGMMTRMFMPLVSFAGTPVDLALGDEEFSLEPFGIHGVALHTPGHSPGSTSLLLDTGDAFVGDLAMNGLPLRIGPGMPRFAEDLSAVKESWRLLLARGAKWIYPAHGKPFRADVLEKSL